MIRASWLIVLYHAAFGVLAWALFRWLSPPLLGQVLAWAVVLYVALFAAMAWLLGQNEALELWTFLLPLSLLQVLPDWILASLFGVLVFPDLGAQRIGPVPVYMAGLWVAPLMVVVWLASIAQRWSGMLALLVACAVSLVIFGVAEWMAPSLGLWSPRSVERIHGIALYVLPAEALLGLATWVVYSAVQGGNLFSKILGAAGVSVFYTGALATSYFVIERIQ